MNRRILRTMGLILALLLAMIGPAAAQEAAIPVLNNTSYSNTLAGSNAGNFEYYSLEYPGDGDVVTITMTTTNVDFSVLSAVGFNVYAPLDGLVAQGIPLTNPNVIEAEVSEPKEGTWLIQVFNYADGLNMNYTISSTVPEAEAMMTPTPAPQATATPVPVTEEPSGPNPLVNGVSRAGVLTGSLAGNFDYYTINYPGDGDVVTITMTTEPIDGVYQNAIGFNIYGPLGTLVAVGRPFADPGTIEVEASEPDAGQWLVQVFNYNPTLTMGYQITAAGLPGVTE